MSEPRPLHRLFPCPGWTFSRTPPEERLRGLSAEDVAKGLSPEVREALAKHLKANGSPPKNE
jgi:hypothetical protein